MNAIEREWRSRAACRNIEDPEIFFPVAHDGPAHAEQVAAAKRMCAGCAVRAQCLGFALARLPYGIAGGLTAEERRGLHQPRPRTSAEPVSLPVEEEVGAGASPAERAATGRALLAAGRPVREVARRCGVAERTASRWATQLRRTTTGRAAAGRGVA